ncbi:MAG: heavy metal translocating P-type ATPase [Rhizobiales bacterium]|nr:heavy metal translocating P-type ATPase [Hyphomicrobiales bacterium]
MVERLRFKVEGMDCASCARKVETGVGRLAGVSDITINTITETLSLSGAAETAGTVEKVVRELGYKPTLLSREPASASEGKLQERTAASRRAMRVQEHGHSEAGAEMTMDRKGNGDEDHDDDDHGAPIEGAWWKSDKGRLVILAGALVGAAFVAAYVFPSASYFVYLAACLVAGLPVAQHAFKALRHGSVFTIEMLMTIAVVGAVLIGAAEEAAIVVFLFAIGELLEGVAAGRARAGIKALATIAPKTAQLETPSGVVETPIEKIAVGSVVVVRPGDRVPADGTILSGASSVDESALTGESMPRSKSEGDVVLAGSINQEAVLRVKVEKPATDTVIARVVRLVEEATEAKAPSERFIDAFSRYYMPAICGLALAVVLVPPLFFGGTWDTWIYRGLTLLLIGCPCALVISTPAAIASSLAAGARRGLLVKGGAVIEQIGKVKHIVFDTGAVEAGSSHPLAVSIMAHAKENGISITAADDSEAMPGKGVRGKVNGREIVVGAAGRLDLDKAIVAASATLEGGGKSVSVVLADGKPIGLIALRDEPRADAKEELAVIKALGLVPIMLTGDNKANGDAIAAALGIEARTELLPEDKLKIVEELAGQGGVAVVGDGINDAPALAAATVGIAMGSGTDVALEAGDAAILNNRIADVAALIVLSRHTMAVVRQNVSLALGLKAVFLVTTLFGLTGLWIAVLADTGATVLVTANALRLLGWSRTRS